MTHFLEKIVTSIGLMNGLIKETIPNSLSSGG
jgi:hypothetical protein